MTRKDYIVVARALNIVASNYAGGYPKIDPQILLIEVVKELSQEFARDNYRFDAGRFEDAVFKK